METRNGYNFYVRRTGISGAWEAFARRIGSQGNVEGIDHFRVVERGKGAKARCRRAIIARIDAVEHSVQRTAETCAICGELPERHHPEDGGHEFRR